MTNRRHQRALLLASVSAVGVILGSTGAQARQTAGGNAEGAEVSEVVVTGFRSSLQKALNEKRVSNAMIDVIKAEDVGKFPESNLAEALQRLPGISIERENGEGRTITVRGLGGDFVRTRINGIETVASSGNNEGQTSINRTRGFDYNVFASDLFSSLKVQKSAEAIVDEGSLGATVDIDTGRPLQIRKKLILSIQDTYYGNGKEHNPRFAGMASRTFFNDKLGVLFSGAYQKRDTGLSFFDRNPGQFEVLYRGSDLAGPVRNGTGGVATPTCAVSGAPLVNATTNRSPLNCFWGFAAPTQTATSPASSGIGRTAFGIDANSLMFGSNPDAWAQLEKNLSTTIPALTSLQQQDLSQERIGLTTTVEFQPTEKTHIRVDGLWAQFKVDNQSHILGSFGLNRQFDNARAEIGLTNTTTGLRPYSASNFNYFADRRGVYGNSCTTSATLDCTGTLGNAARPVFATTQYWNGSGYVSVPTVLGSNTWSTNPYNLDTYDYYNNPGSVGYNAAMAATDPRGILMYDQLVGKPHTTLQDLHINEAGQVDYMKLNRLDWLSNNAYSKNNSIFNQIDLTIDQQFTDKLSGQFVYGKSYSHLRINGGRVDLFTLDKDGFVYDERGGGDMPIFNPNFNAADVNQWGGGDIVKGYAGIARYVRALNNRYETYRGDFRYEWNDHLTLSFGASQRKYEFETFSSTFSRGVIPSIKELNKYGREQNKSEYANLTLAQMGSVVDFGAGLKLPAGTPTSWFSPDRDTFARLLGYECNCVNDFADWRLQTTLGDGLYVQEKDTGAYVQGDFDVELFGRRLRGNAGVRVVKTEVDSIASGTSGALNGTVMTGANSYTDTLPSLNLVYELTDTLMVRFAAAKTMARPSLGNLSPGVTSISLPTALDSGANTPRVTLGNPKLEPFRSDNFDLNFEWYPQSSTLVSVALFRKKLGSYPRQQSFNTKLDEFLPAELYTTLRNGLSLTPAQAAYLDGENIWTVTSYVDSPGGYVNGIELQYQQALDFLPGFLKDFGVIANVTHIKSELNYLTQSGKWAKAPWPFASPNAVNLTLYYEKGPFEGRVSYSWRDRFASVFPQSIGLCPPGLDTDPATGGVCTSPFNDFGGVESTQYVDAKVSYKFSKKLRADLSVQNLFNEPESQWNYEPSVVRKYSAGAGRIVAAGFRYTF
jgi:TonB-dependent receptor